MAEDCTCTECGRPFAPWEFDCSIRWGKATFEFCDFDCMASWSMTEMGWYKLAFGVENPGRGRVRRGSVEFREIDA